jgi:Mn-dependent DtxR family transcriptional regulator
MSPDGLITLNESGLEIARRVYSRHQVITKLFVMMGVSQEVAAEDACRVEHDLSQETFEKIRDFVSRQEEM